MIELGMLQRFLDKIPAPYAILKVMKQEEDIHAEYVYVNPSYKDTVDHPYAQFEGQDISAFWKYYKNPEWIRFGIENILNGETVHTMIFAEKLGRYLEIVISPLGNEHYIFAILDSTDKPLQENVSRKTGKKYIKALTKQSLCFFELDVTTQRFMGTTIRHQQGKEYDLLDGYGLPHYCEISQYAQTCQKYIDKKDRVKYLEFFSEAYMRKNFEAGNVELSLDYLCYSPAGKPYWVRQFALLGRDEENDHLMAFVYVLDRSAEMRAQMEKEEALKNERRMSLQLQSKTEYARKRDAFHEAVSRANIGEYYIDLRSGRYQSFKHSKGFSYAFPAVDDWDTQFTAYVNACAPTEGRENLLEKFSLPYLNRYFADETNNSGAGISVETHVMYDGKPTWIRREAYLVDRTYDGRPFHAAVVVKIVDEEVKLREKTTQALKEAYEAAQRANEAKTSFLSSMSHDIRTPMNGIIGMTTIAKAQINDKERVRDCLQKIDFASQHLLSIINEVLDVSHIESGHIELEEEALRLSNVVDNLLALTKPQMDERGHRLKVHLEEIKHENIIGDSLRIQQVFVNIMSNAIKYTPNHGLIELTIREHPTNRPNIGCYEFVFRDNGIGISPKFLPKLFDPFARSEDEYTARTQGTGLGMMIAKNIVHMMDGDIQVHSTVGEGTEVAVTIYLKLQETQPEPMRPHTKLPILVVNADAGIAESIAKRLRDMGMQSDWVNRGTQAVDRVREHHLEGKDYYAVILDRRTADINGLQTTAAIREAVGQTVKIVFTAYDWKSIKAEALAAGVDVFANKPLFRSRLEELFYGPLKYQEAEPKTTLDDIAQMDFSSKRFLLVEDNELNREIALEILSVTGAKLESAENGKLAVDMVADHPPYYYDLIFMDIRMPVMNGYQAAYAIRSLGRPDTDSIPIIALTANAFAEDVVAAQNAGMNEHMAKPIEQDKLYDTLKRWVK